ncbi:MAG: hypothetical protein SH807_03660 [Blastochloris sp.]|nr:hypothetical protein [Blastochloris sp.]
MTNPNLNENKVSIRLHPRLSVFFKDAESRHFKDEELDTITAERPDLKNLAETCRLIRNKDVALINKVVKEVFSQYEYDQHHDFASAKCPRDVRYVVTYSCAAMLAEDPQWLDDKLLIWLKTILQAFEFPLRKPGSGGALFSDKILEDKLKLLPQKTQSIYHCYYRLRQEMEKELDPEHYKNIQPFLTASLNVLTEEY